MKRGLITSLNPSIERFLFKLDKHLNQLKIYLEPESIFLEKITYKTITFYNYPFFI